MQTVLFLFLGWSCHLLLLRPQFANLSETMAVGYCHRSWFTHSLPFGLMISLQTFEPYQSQTHQSGVPRDIKSGYTEGLNSKTCIRTLFFLRMGCDPIVQQSTWMERRSASEMDLGIVDQNKNPATQYGSKLFDLFHRWPYLAGAEFTRNFIQRALSIFHIGLSTSPRPPPFFQKLTMHLFYSGGLRIVRLVMSAATYHSENFKLKDCLQSIARCSQHQSLLLTRWATIYRTSNVVRLVKPNSKRGTW